MYISKLFTWFYIYLCISPAFLLHTTHKPTCSLFVWLKHINKHFSLQRTITCGSVTSTEARHNYDRCLAIQTLMKLFLSFSKLCRSQSHAACCQEHNANVLWLMHRGSPEASTVMHIVMRAIFDFALCALCGCSAICLQGNSCVLYYSI